MGAKCRRCGKKAYAVLLEKRGLCKPCYKVFSEIVDQLTALFYKFPTDIIDGLTIHKYTPMLHLAGLLNDNYDLDKPERAELMHRKIKNNVKQFGGFTKWFEQHNREMEEMQAAADEKVRTIWTNRKQHEFIVKHMGEILKYAESAKAR